MTEATPYDYDLFVIGAGSGGVRAARIASGHGARVAIAEEHRVGGTCVIRGCVPKKLLVYGSHFAEDLKDSEKFGWTVGTPSFSWPALRDSVLNEVTRLEGLYGQTLANNNVTVFKSLAKLVGPHEIELADGQRVTAGHILVATGGWPVRPNVPGAEYGITSNEVFHLEQFPRRVVIAGGGYIANEFAGIFNALGAQVTVVNRSDAILRGYDEQIRDRLLQISMAKGIQFRFNAPFEWVEKREDGSLSIKLAGSDPIEADLLLFATGRAPRSGGIGLEDVGVEFQPNGAIKVDDYSQTSVEHIYAVGDVTDRVQLTPVAIREGHAFADTVFGGRPVKVDHSNIPMAVFSHPPIAGVGLTEAQARNELGSVKVFTSDFRPMKNVLADRNERALYKMVVNAANDQVVGLHMIGPDSAEILQAAAIAVKAGLTKAQFDDTIALHPTMAEELVLLK